MRYDDFLRQMPKVELHCHLEGTVRPTTFVELATKNGVMLPTADPVHVYQYPYVDFFTMYLLLCESIVDHGDFARVTYESMQDGATFGNLKYREMFFSPTNHLRFGTTYRTMVDGIIEGLQAAEADLGVRGRLVPSIDRTAGPSAALHLIEEVLADKRDEVVGIGMDGQEALGPPEVFAEAYAAAKKGGLHRTAHVCEDGPPSNVNTCLDVLGCERLDHGYLILGDAAVIERARSEGVIFNCKVRTLRTSMRQHPVKEMVRQGLKVTLNTDDPGMEPTNLAVEYIDTAMIFNYDASQMRQLCLNGVDAAWVDDTERRSMRGAFQRELDALQSGLESDAPPEFLSYYRSGREEPSRPRGE